MKRNNFLIFFVVWSLLLTVVGCAKEKQQPALLTTVTTPPKTDTPMSGSPADTTHTNSDTGFTYLALGDSYTIGQSVGESERFPAQAVQMLQAMGIHVQAPQYIATTGWTTQNLLDAINYQNPPNNFDIVTLLIGVNDQYQHLDTIGYASRFAILLNHAVTLAGNRPKRVIVLSIPDYSATPFVSQSDKARVSQELERFNAICKQITLVNNIAYIDITPLTQKAATDPSLIAPDGLHPSGKEYSKWVELLVPDIENALK